MSGLQKHPDVTRSLQAVRCRKLGAKCYVTLPHLCVCVSVLLCDAANDKSRAVVRLRNVVMELRKVVNHPSLLGLDLDTSAYTRAVEARKAQAAAAAMKARGEYT